LLAKHQVLKQQIAARAKNADMEVNQIPQQAQHEVSIMPRRTKLGLIWQLFDLNVDRYFGDPQCDEQSICYKTIT
jgi:hypothetical protein